MEKRPLILAVDDEGSILKLLEVNLSASGYCVATATSGASAVRWLEEHDPDLVILDLVMAGLDGLQVIGLIRQRSSVPILMLTGVIEVTTVHDALVAGADDYMTKPFSIVELTARIKAKLRLAGRESEATIVARTDVAC
jgi:DNA-binding response OmpR family regulator